MTTNGRAQSDKPNVAASFGDLAHDVIELTELQAELLAMDVRETSRTVRLGLILGIAGIVIFLGSVPVMLAALAYVLVEQGGWSHAAGFGGATIVGLLLSALIVAAAWWKLRSSAVTLHRSRDELKRNIAWVKSSLRNRGQANLSDFD
jgi:uncharacterized membrane protein YqjE